MTNGTVLCNYCVGGGNCGLCGAVGDGSWGFGTKLTRLCPQCASVYFAARDAADKLLISFCEVCDGLYLTETLKRISTRRVLACERCQAAHEQRLAHEDYMSRFDSSS